MIPVSVVVGYHFLNGIVISVSAAAFGYHFLNDITIPVSVASVGNHFLNDIISYQFLLLLLIIIF